jgi:hypothetical protein
MMIDQQPQRPTGGPHEPTTERLTRQAERARARFEEELRGLVADLRDARRAVRDSPLPGEWGDGKEGRAGE